MIPGKKLLTVIALVLSVFMAALEATVVSTAMPTVISQLGGVELYGWVTAAYLLASTVSVPLYGKIADMRGRRPVILAGTALFLAGSLGSGLSQTILQLILFRVIQGLGAGAMAPMAMTIVGDLFVSAERVRVQSFFSATWGVTGFAGPLIGGAIVKYWSWRWVFWVNLPIGLISCAMIIYAFRERPQSRSLSFDSLGFALLTTLATLLLLSVSGKRDTLLLLPAAICLVAFIFVERRARSPVLDLSLFRDRLFAVASLLAVLLGGTMMGTASFLPLWIQGVVGGTPAQAGGVLSPMLVAWPIATATMGRHIDRIGSRRLVVGGSACTALGALGLALAARPDSGMALLYGAGGIIGFGLGLTLTPLVIAVQNSVGWEQRGVATAACMFFRTMGGAMASGCLGGILAGRLVEHVPSPLLSRMLNPHGADGAGGVALSEASKEVRATLASALQLVFFSAAGFALLAFVLSWFLPRSDPKVSQGTPAGESPV